MQIRVVSLNVGKPRRLEGHSKEIMSGIAKQATDRPLFLSKVNLEGDGQADLAHHGGEDKAVCGYCSVHYPYWEQRLGISLGPAAFGENVTLEGCTEEEVCIGDIFRWGQALLQISQPRQPCFKIAAYHGIPEFTAYVEQTGYTGFYFRVLETGLVGSSDPLERLQGGKEGFSVAFANEVMFKRKADAAAIRTLLGAEALSASWRNTLSKRLSKLEQD